MCSIGMCGGITAAVVAAAVVAAEAAMGMVEAAPSLLCGAVSALLCEGVVGVGAFAEAPR